MAKYASAPNTYLPGSDFVTNKLQLSRGMILNSNILSVVKEWQLWEFTQPNTVTGYESDGTAFRQYHNIITLNFNLTFTYAGGAAATNLVFTNMPFVVNTTPVFVPFINTVTIHNLTTNTYYTGLAGTSGTVGIAFTLPSQFQNGQEYTIQGTLDYQIA